MFCVERRKAWRMLQSKAGIVNKEYAAQRDLLAEVDAGKLPLGRVPDPRPRVTKERLTGGVLANATTNNNSNQTRTRTLRSAFLFLSVKSRNL
jgi:hypothetical protein